MGINILFWALATGIIIGVVWATIVLVGGRRREQDLHEVADAYRAELDEAQRNVAELEERLQFAERILTQQQTDSRLPPAER